MNYDYLAKIRGMVQLYTQRKTFNVLEGGFRSLIRGRSLEFDDLKEYTYGDNVHDIDWKSSSRTGKTLIRRYLAERRHNILFIGDTGSKMSGSTQSLEEKAEVSVVTMGTIAYLADRQGADYALAYGGERGVRFSMFRSGPEHLQGLLTQYRKTITQDPELPLEQVLERALNQSAKRMIVIVLTDPEGAARIDDRLIRKVTHRNDLLVISVSDASLTGQKGRVYDLDLKSYAADFFRQDRRLREAEKKAREQRLVETQTRFRRSHVGFVTISSEEEILDRIVELFERQKIGVQ
ncbi:MAG: DUF58 domain-containing protein [Lachnospiraceae bacterium]|nr:DUF58 domain-containing protein [Lachnospiraceae bacterium]MBQ9643935.1 DUF58 domain-containing protein [Lachnospiraceae bacterium]